MQQQFLVDLEFQWWRDAKGYELVLDTLDPPGALAPRTGLASWPVPELLLPSEKEGASFPLHNLGLPRKPRIVRLGGELVPYRPLDSIDDIFRAYINLVIRPDDTPDTVTWELIRDFIDRYGPLSRDGLDENLGENVGTVLNHLYLMNKYVDARLADDGAAIRQLLGGGELGATGIIPFLSYDPGSRTPKLRFHLPSLHAALWLHLMRSFDSGAVLRRCEWEGCGIVFEAGAGTGRRADSKFCSDQHRIAYHSVHRAPRPAAQPPRRRGRPRLNPRRF